MARNACRSSALPIAPRSSPAGQRTETFFAFGSAQRGSRNRFSASLSAKARRGNASTWPDSTTASTPRVGASSAQLSSSYVRTTSAGSTRPLVVIAAAFRSADAQPRHGAGVRLEDEQARMRLVVGVRRGEHHAFADAELHLARCEVGDDHGQLADELLGRVGRLDAAEDGARARLADVER